MNLNGWPCYSFEYFAPLTKHSRAWLNLSDIKNPSLHCRLRMLWLWSSHRVTSGRVPLGLGSSASLPWKWLLADILRVIFGALLCYCDHWLVDLHARRYADDKLFWKSLCVRQPTSTNPESKLQGWLNINHKTSRSLEWVNGSDMIGIHGHQGVCPGPATLSSSLSLWSVDTSFMAHMRRLYAGGGDSPPAVTGTRCGWSERLGLFIREYIWILTDAS